MKVFNRREHPPLLIFAIQQTIGFVDPSADPNNPGWPLRNLLAYLRALYPATTSTIRILRWKDSEIPSTPNAIWKSQIGILKVGAAAPIDPVLGRPSAVGWEKNPQGKLGPRVADLAPMMDPTRYSGFANIVLGNKLLTDEFCVGWLHKQSILI